MEAERKRQAMSIPDLGHLAGVVLPKEDRTSVVGAFGQTNDRASSGRRPFPDRRRGPNPTQRVRICSSPEAKRSLSVSADERKLRWHGKPASDAGLDWRTVSGGSFDISYKGGEFEFFHPSPE